jgi:NurA domain
MLFRELLVKELEERSGEFARFAGDWSAAREHYANLLNELASADPAELRQKFAGEANIGALPSDELDAAKGLTFSFPETWQNHEQARRWAMTVLENRTTFAADGSQISPDKNISLPFAAVQVGWFENSHTGNGGNGTSDYDKGARFVVIAPDDLMYQDREHSNQDTRVGLRRFSEEIAEAKRFIESKRGWQKRGEKMPLAFFDGTLLISISLPKSKIQGHYVAKMLELVRSSEETRVPLIGYIDRSEARDVVSLLDLFNTGKPADSRATVYDPHVISFKNWGDRSIFYHCRRQNLAEFYDEAIGRDMVGFVYLQTTGDETPSRIDIPVWIYEEGLLDELVDTVRAECVIGLGYPYPLEAADATAVIGTAERDSFLRALQDFAKKNNLPFSVSRKSASKGRRR